MGGKASIKGDVYSFGVVLMEMFTARKPTDEIFQRRLNQNKNALAVLATQVSGIVDPAVAIDTDSSYEVRSVDSSSGSSNLGGSTSCTIGIEQNRTNDCLAAIIRVGLLCAQHSPNDRLTMRETLIKLQEIRKFLLEL